MCGQLRLARKRFHLDSCGENWALKRCTNARSLRRPGCRDWLWRMSLLSRIQTTPKRQAADRWAQSALRRLLLATSIRRTYRILRRKRKISTVHCGHYLGTTRVILATKVVTSGQVKPLRSLGFHSKSLERATRIELVFSA